MVVISYPFVQLATYAIISRTGSRDLWLGPGDQVVCAVGLVIGPGVMLAIANEAFEYPWSKSMVLAVWCIAGISVLVSLWSRRMLRSSAVNFLAIVALAGVCLCYTFASLISDFSIMAIVPLAPFVNLSRLARKVWACGQMKLNPMSTSLTETRVKERNMNTQRFVAIAVIFAVASLGWALLGRTIDYRTDKLADSLSSEVDTMWGPAGIVQSTPCILAGGLEEMNQGQYQTPAHSDVKVSFEHDNRYKGLLWFSTYTVRFNATYKLAALEEDATFLFKLPDDVHSLEDLTFAVNGEPVESDYSTSHGLANTLQVPVASGLEQTVEVEYTTRGRDNWAYSSQWCTGVRPGILRNFTLTAITDFSEVDYPSGSVSPTSPAEKSETGATAIWRYKSMRANQTMGIEMPSRTNAGPIAARMSFFAPVSLAFFFTVLFTVVVLKKLPLHPMHYLFISAGFFAFHILMAYLVDLISIHAAFWICAAVSTALVVSYMRLVAGVKFAVIYVGAAQLVYLVGFSYAFFWVGATGLTLTIGAIATLFVLMQATGRVDWSEVFKVAPEGKKQWVTVPPLPDEPHSSDAGRADGKSE